MAIIPNSSIFREALKDEEGRIISYDLEPNMLTTPFRVHAIRSNSTRRNYIPTNSLTASFSSSVIRSDIPDKLRALYSSGQISGWTYDSGHTVETYDVNGLLFKIENSDGRWVRVSRNGLVTTVVSDTGQSLILTKNAEGEMVSSTDTAGNEYIYHHVDGVLQYVQRADGSKRQYMYTDTRFPWALTEIRDSQNKLVAKWTYDAAGRAQSSEHADGKEFVSFAYNDAAQTVTVTNALGKNTILHYELFLGAKKFVRVEGVASTNCMASTRFQSFDTNGYKQTVTDDEGNVTLYERDARGRTTLQRSGLQWASGEPQYGLDVDLSLLQVTADTAEVETCWHESHNKPSKVITERNVTLYEYYNSGALKSKKVVAKTASNDACS